MYRFKDLCTDLCTSFSEVLHFTVRTIGLATSCFEGSSETVIFPVEFSGIQYHLLNNIYFHLSIEISIKSYFIYGILSELSVLVHYCVFLLIC